MYIQIELFLWNERSIKICCQCVGIICKFYFKNIQADHQRNSRFIEIQLLLLLKENKNLDESDDLKQL